MKWNVELLENNPAKVQLGISKGFIIMAFEIEERTVHQSPNCLAKSLVSQLVSLVKH